MESVREHKIIEINVTRCLQRPSEHLGVRARRSRLVDEHSLDAKVRLLGRQDDGGIFETVRTYYDRAREAGDAPAACH